MAFSTITNIGDGVTTDWAVTYNYLDESHIIVRVNKVETTSVGSAYKFEWLNPTTLRVTTVIDSDPVPVGVEIEFVRRTPIAEPAVVFGGGASLSSENLNKNSEYLTYALQEATDANDAFTTLYLGAKEANPDVDNAGNALLVGASYFNTVDKVLYYWTGTVWLVSENTALVTSALADALTAQSLAEAAQASAEVAKADAETARGFLENVSATATTLTPGSSATAAYNAGTGVFTLGIPTGDAGADGSDATVPFASQAEAEAGVENTKAMTPLRTKQAIDIIPSPVKAWVNFNGTGTVAIRQSFNVSSVTDNGTGDYTVNFTNALEDSNFAAIGTAGSEGVSSGLNRSAVQVAAFSASSVRIQVNNHGNGYPGDPEFCSVVIFR